MVDKSIFDEIREIGEDGVPIYKMLVDGKWIDSSDGKTFEVRNPGDCSLVGRVPSATKEDVLNAIEVTYRGKSRIRACPAIERIELFEIVRNLLEQYKSDFINMIVKEAGKPIKVVEGEVKATMERLRLTMEETRKIYGEYLPGDWVDDTVGKVAFVIRQPLGVIAAICPFNYPLYIASSKIAPALVSGNGVIVKPSSEDPICLLMFARLLQEAGFPDGCINFVTGRGGEIGDLIVTNDKVNMITFTGSTDVGKRIAYLIGMKERHLELGGKGAGIVLDDADLDLAAKKCVTGALKFSGQRCDALSNFFVQENVKEIFVKKVLEEVDKWKMGDPIDPATDIGPLINERAIKRIDSLVQNAINKGAKLLRGGKYKDLFYEPIVLDKVTLDMEVAKEEIFGPVISIITVKDLDEAIELANQSKYGLDSSVFTNNLYKAWKAGKKLDDGTVTINEAPAHGVGNFPFGGNKNSGIGREGLGYSIDEMTRIHTIVINMVPGALHKERHVLI